MGLLIDATVFIDHERGRLELSEHVPAGSTDEMFVSVVTASELFHGVHRADGPVTGPGRPGQCFPVAF